MRYSVMVPSSMVKMTLMEPFQSILSSRKSAQKLSPRDRERVGTFDFWNNLLPAHFLVSI